MLLTEWIPEACIVASLGARKKREAVVELARTLVEAGHVEDEERLVEQLMLRESTESTGIGRGLAIPHARVPALERLICAVGRADAGLDYKAVDRQPVHLVFLILYPPSQQTLYLNFVATLMRLFRDEDPMRLVLEASTAQEMFEILDRLSRTLVKPEEQLAQQLKGGPHPEGGELPRVDLVLLARLELCAEMLDTAESGRDEIERRIRNIRGLLDPSTLQHYDQLKRGGRSALAAVEGDTCQGCFRQLPSQLVQVLRSESDRIYTCTHCNRFIYGM